LVIDCLTGINQSDSSFRHRLDTNTVQTMMQSCRIKVRFSVNSLIKFQLSETRRHCCVSVGV